MKKTVLHVALLALTAPLSAYSLGLGKMTVTSALDQPFSAEIELVDIGSVSLKEVKVGVADPENFTQIGLERAAVLSLLTFTITKNKHGKEVIKIQSTERMSDPYMELVVDLTWPAGQLYKAYTILLDPPGYHLVSTTIQGSPTHYIRHTQKSSEPGVVDKTIVTSITHNPEQVSESKKQSTYGPTVANESVWQIAQRYKTSDTILPQVVLAIVGANPSAFTDGNLNGLKIGVKLTIPSTSEIKQVSAELATSEAMAHDKAWNTKTPVEHVLTPPYTSGQAVEKTTSYSTNAASGSQGANSSIVPVPPANTVPQLITTGANPLTNQPTQQNQVPQSVESSSTSKAEVSIAAAAIESVREANALLMEQLRILQKQNSKLQKQLEQRNTELKELRSQIHLLLKQRQSLPSQASASEYSDSMSLWPFILLLLVAGGGAGAFWYLRMRKGEDIIVSPTTTAQPLAPIEPASFILPREEVNAEAANPEAEKVSTNELIITDQPKNTVSEPSQEMKIEPADIEEMTIAAPEKQLEQDEGLPIEDKGLESTQATDELLKEDLNPAIKEEAIEAEPLEFSMTEIESPKEEFKEPALSLDEERNESKNESAEEEYLEFEAGLHKKLSSAEEETAKNTEIKEEQTDDGIDFASSIEPVEAKIIDKKEEKSLEVDDELQKFFVEENTSDASEQTLAQEEVAPDLLKSQKALDTLLALAKTYISMDDIESARTSLNEVLEHGSPKQKEEAASLLESIKT